MAWNDDKPALANAISADVPDIEENLQVLRDMIYSDNGGATVGPTVTLHRDSASPADNDVIGTVNFDGEDDGSNQTTYAAVRVVIIDVTNTEEDGNLEIYTNKAGTLTKVATFDNLGAVGIGVTPTANMTGLAIEDGILTIKETTTPTADVNYGKVYCKSDNKLYFQDGVGNEHEIAVV